MFNQSNSLKTAMSNTSNPMQDFEVVSPPDDSISSLAFSPASIPQNFLVAGSWDCNVRCWEVEQSGKTVPKSMQSMAAPVLAVCWSDVSLLIINKYAIKYNERNWPNNSIMDCKNGCIIIIRMEPKYSWRVATRQQSVGT